MNKNLLIVAFTILSFALFITYTHSGEVFAQIQSTESASQSAQPGQPAQPGQQSGQSLQPGPSIQSDHSGQNQTGQNQTGQEKGPLAQMSDSLSKIIGQK